MLKFQFYSNAGSCDITCEGDCGNSSINSISADASNAFNPATVTSREITDNNSSTTVPSSCDITCKNSDSVLSPADANGMNKSQNMPMTQITDKRGDKKLNSSFKDPDIRKHNETSNISTQTPPRTHL